MARPKKSDLPDLRQRINLTAGAIERLTCPSGKLQDFLRDSEAPGLRVRVTTAGAKSFVYEAKLNRQTIRRTIGDVKLWSIEQARIEARSLAVLLDGGQDPREIDRQQQADKAAEKAVAASLAVTVGEIWPLYLQTGRPKRRDAWKPRYLADLIAMAAQGGVPKKRGKGNTRPGPLYPLMALALANINEDTLKSWFDQEAISGKHQAARALMMFRGFLRWCAARPNYRAMTDRDAGRAPAILENLPQVHKRTDALQVSQVHAWWAGVEQLNNRTASAYLRALLLTGARREELAALTWSNVDFQWRKLTIADKVVSTRTIPLPPYLAQLLAGLPRVGPYVFNSASKAGRITDTRNSHAKVLQSAGVEKLTIHGLRRTFTQRGRQVAPHGAVAQIQGHTPSATAEGYAVLTLDDLRPYAEEIEAYILSLAGVQFSSVNEPLKLRVVAEKN